MGFRWTGPDSPGEVVVHAHTLQFAHLGDGQTVRLRVCEGDPRPYWPCGIEVIVPDENLSGFTSVGPGIVLGIRRGGGGLEFEVLEGPFSEKYPSAR